MRRSWTIVIGRTAAAIPLAAQAIEDRDLEEFNFPDFDSVRGPIAETSLGATTEVKFVLNTTSEEEHEVTPAPQPSPMRQP